MQGFNMGRYVPPDEEGVVSGNKLHKKHALGARANKLSQGILTVRFEMPFAVWCATCPRPTIIGQGVRFNAEKRKVGMYHSTPVLAFRMRHPACGGAIELRTDPANTAYVVTEGAKKRDVGDGGAADSLVDFAKLVEIRSARETQDAREQSFATLEKTIAHRTSLIETKRRIGELEDASRDAWEDPYARNQALRRTFRARRKEGERESAAAEAIKDRMSLGIELLPSSEEDARRAALIDFAPESEVGPVDRVLAQPLFGMARIPNMGEVVKAKERDSTKGTKLKAEIAASKAKASLVSTVLGNTRMAKDPFLEGYAKGASRGSPSLPALRKKRPVEGSPSQPAREPKIAMAAAQGAAGCLVNYDSESD